MRHFKLLFVRSDGAGSCYAAMEFWTTKDYYHDTSGRPATAQALEALKDAVDEWSRKSAKGRRVRKYSADDTNIGDLADYLDPMENSIRPFLLRHGFLKFRITGWSEADIVSYDTVLVRPK